MSTLSFRFLRWTPLLAYIAGVQAATRSVIVDDAAVNQITYSKGWNIGNECAGCAAHPSTAIARDGTWHDGTESADRLDEVFFIFAFTGTSIEVRHIAIDLIGPWTTNTNVSYSIDGGSPNVAQRASTNETDYLYDQLLFRIDGLSNVQHTLRVDLQRPGVLLLDYLNYTEIADVQATTSLGTPPSSSLSPSSSSTTAFGVLDVNVGAIIGGVFSGVIIILVASTFWYCLRRRRNRAQARLAPTPIANQVSPSDHPYIPTKLAGREPYNPTHTEHVDRYSQPISSQSIPPTYSSTHSRPPISSDVPSNTPPTTLNTSKGSSMSGVVSHSSVQPRPGHTQSTSNRNQNQTTSLSTDEPVEQGLMSMSRLPQTSPPPYAV